MTFAWARHFRVFGLSLLALGACSNAAEPGQSRADAVILNAEPTYAHREVGRLSTNSCVGTLIASSVVLTTADCVGGQSDSTGGGLGFLIDLAAPGAATAAQAQAYQADAVQVVSGANLAVMHLSQPVAKERATPATLAHRQPQPEDLVTAWGYGCTAAAGEQSRANEKHETDYFFATAAGVTCPGWAGGPRVTEGTAIFQLTVRGDQTADVVAHADAIEQLIAGGSSAPTSRTRPTSPVDPTTPTGDPTSPLGDPTPTQ